MTLADRLAIIVAALPSDSASVTLTRADLVAMLGDTEQRDAAPTGDLTVEEVGAELKRAPSTVRGWLIKGELRGYKLNDRDWRVTRAALRAYLEAQAAKDQAPTEGGPENVDLGAWRRARGTG